jgi:hypothetical protein
MRLMTRLSLGALSFFRRDGRGKSVALMSAHRRDRDLRLVRSQRNGRKANFPAGHPIPLAGP